MRTPATNRRLAQWRVKWLIDHSTSHQLLWCIDSFVLRNPPLRQAPKRSTLPRCKKMCNSPLCNNPVAPYPVAKKSATALCATHPLHFTLLQKKV